MWPSLAALVSFIVRCCWTIAAEFKSAAAAFRCCILATVICEARQVCIVPCDCISDNFCASAAFSRFNC